MSDETESGKGSWQFFTLTYLIALLTWGSMIVLKLPGGSTDPSAPPPPPLGLLLVRGGCAPSIAGVLMTWWVGGLEGLRDLWGRAVRFRLGWKAYLFLFAFPLLAVGLRAILYLMGGSGLGRSAQLTSPLALASFTLQIAVLGPITEEFGWRGFALDALLAKFPPSRASLVLGTLWAFWHCRCSSSPARPKRTMAARCASSPSSRLCPSAPQWSALGCTWAQGVACGQRS